MDLDDDLTLLRLFPRELLHDEFVCVFLRPHESLVRLRDALRLLRRGRHGRRGREEGGEALNRARGAKGSARSASATGGREEVRKKEKEREREAERRDLRREGEEKRGRGACFLREPWTSLVSRG